MADSVMDVLCGVKKKVFSNKIAKNI